MKTICRATVLLLAMIVALSSGAILSSLFEAYEHNVSLYDAVFIESWKYKGDL